MFDSSESKVSNRMDDATTGRRKPTYWKAARMTDIKHPTESKPGYPIQNDEERSDPKKSDPCKWGLTG